MSAGEGGGAALPPPLNGGAPLGGAAGAPAAAGEAGEPAGGTPNDYPAVVSLCLYPQDIPEAWSATGTSDVGGFSCPVGVEGVFRFNACNYRLLSPTPFDVDPFVGGHSHCCYQSRLLDCR